MCYYKETHLLSIRIICFLLSAGFDPPCVERLKLLF